ncbi:hypothetical protein [Neptunomonas sp.]|uniref:hypothetical protein n=1 Tax=Neptunomonas sp. TaxID=1971898 RepID=UPI0025E22FD7|nr:hypothetical protein [Neptunomonas sp.]
MPEQPNNTETLTADKLLRLYVSTDDNDSKMPRLIQERNHYLDNIDDISTAEEVTGLIHWLLRDHHISAQGETLDEIADRLGDLDIEANTDQYSELIFLIKIATERLDIIMLDSL